MLLVIEKYVFQFDEGSKHTDTRRLTNQALAILKDAAQLDSDTSKKVDEILRGRK